MLVRGATRFALGAVVAAALLPACKAPPSPGAIVVVTSWPGQHASAVEQAITAPIEDALAGVPGVDDVVSSSTAGVSTVVAVVAPKQSLLHVADGARTALEGVQRALPADVFAPVIEQRARGVRVIARYALSSSTLPRTEVTRIAEQMARGLEQTPGVAAVAVKDGAHREIEVRVDGARGRAMSISAAAVADVLRGYPAKNIVDLAAVPVMRVPEVHVSDVASISEAVVDDDAAAGPVLLEVTQQAGAAVALAAAPAAPSPAVDVKPLPLDDDAPLAVLIAAGSSTPAAASDAELARKARALVDDNMAGNAGFYWSGAPSGADARAAPALGSEVSLELARDKAAALGVSAEDVASAVRMATAGEIALRIDDVPVRVSQPVDEHAPLGAQIFVPTRTGGLVPLAEVANEIVGAAPRLIARADRRRAIVLCGAVGGGAVKAGAGEKADVAKAKAAVAARLKALALPPGGAVDVVDDRAAAEAVCPRAAGANANAGNNGITR